MSNVTLIGIDIGKHTFHLHAQDKFGNESTGGRPALLGISKRGDKNLRRLLVQCARVYLMRLKYQKGPLADWVCSLLVRRHSNVVACALANKLARIAWAITTRHTQYKTEPDAMNA